MESPNLPSDYKTLHGFPMVGLTVTLRSGGGLEITRRDIKVETQGNWGPNGKFTNQVVPAPGSDFVAGNNSLSSKHVYGDGLSAETFSGGPAHLSFMRVFGYCAVPDEAKCLAYLLEILRIDYEAVKDHLKAELTAWESCDLTVPVPETQTF